MPDKPLLLLVAASAGAAIGPPPTPASLEHWQTWVGLIAFGVLGSLLNNRKRLTNRQEFLEAALLGFGAAVLVATAYGLGGQILARYGVVATPMLLASVSGLLGAIGVQKRLDLLDQRVNGALEHLPGLGKGSDHATTPEAPEHDAPPPAP